MSISRVLCQRIFVRQFRSSASAFSGGGGGRPGGRPVLSWKEKRLLNEREREPSDVPAESTYDISDAGSFEDFEKHFDLSTATVTDLDKLDTFQEPEDLQRHVKDQLAEEKKAQGVAIKGKRRQKGPRSFVMPSMLFGSHKSEGYMIPSTKAPSKVRFNHQRVFGNKNKLASGDACE
mmetsp:Transcript_11058/g.18067  ORF Transcript_11058/g.18067 Transcript_11058/m.18067 type:complete len:177 (-) Transcript_11058:252-782(-)|eukprot:CAMPEP_0114431554 /NCGR_PEP_ID=MMETSP0103-20121206/10668_1 /TAXON_ID=37642 ORGANISM="Paraphysomonas imperforata, Strain PA2" /NCGR_SAMPLE_ID=MMETSP0103 /ASSEMBLY_ACC=CAM_ASM_000201 /LENGTH=176 /DNA_ID=CAMNT_0001601139 /DNA_START=68 /DNA_END=598 /DNA_ORIENTATION=+